MTQQAVKMNPAGIRAVLTHPKIQDIINERTQRIREAAGEGFRTRPRPQRIQRYGNQVRTADQIGRRRQSDDNVLIKAIGAGA